MSIKLLKSVPLYGERSRVKCLVLARPARRNKALDEVSAVNAALHPLGGELRQTMKK